MRTVFCNYNFAPRYVIFINLLGYLHILSESSGESCPELCSDFDLENVKCLGQADRTATNMVHCYCDYSCMAFEDCCSDFSTLCALAENATVVSLNQSVSGLTLEPNDVGGDETERSPWKDRLNCNEADDWDNRFYVVNSCPDLNITWSLTGVGSFGREMCNGSAVRTGDVLESIPVVHINSGMSYMNSFCAVCNGMSLKEVRLWDVSYFCETGSIGPPPQSRDRKVSQQVAKMWDKMAKSCDSLFRINVETGAYVRRCAVNRSDTAGLTSCLEGLSYFWMSDNAELKLLEDANDRSEQWNLTVHGERYSIQVLPGEKMRMTFGQNSRLYEMDVCDMLPLDDLCWSVSKTPNCVQRLAKEVFHSNDFEIREQPLGCKFNKDSHELVIKIAYFTGWALSFVFFAILIVLKRSAMNDRKTSSFETNAMIVLIFIWFKQGFHCVKFFTRCSVLAPFMHFCQDSAFMWVFVMGYDLQLERRDLMPPFLYMMSSWVAPLLVTLVGAMMSMGRFGLFWLYTSTNICWYAPLYWEVPFIVVPIGLNFYLLVLTGVNMSIGSLSNPHQVKYVVMFPLLFVEYMLTMMPAYVDNEVLMVVALFAQSYMGLVLGGAYFALSMNDQNIDESR